MNSITLCVSFYDATSAGLPTFLPSWIFTHASNNSNQNKDSQNYMKTSVNFSKINFCINIPILKSLSKQSFKNALNRFNEIYFKLGGLHLQSTVSRHEKFCGNIHGKPTRYDGKSCYFNIPTPQLIHVATVITTIMISAIIRTTTDCYYYYQYC